jgi:hypothetical protein
MFIPRDLLSGLQAPFSTTDLGRGRAHGFIAGGHRALYLINDRQSAAFLADPLKPSFQPA